MARSTAAAAAVQVSGRSGRSRPNSAATLTPALPGCRDAGVEAPRWYRPLTWPILLPIHPNGGWWALYIVYHTAMLSMSPLFVRRRCVDAEGSDLPMVRCEVGAYWQGLAPAVTAVGLVAPATFFCTMCLCFWRGGFSVEGPPSGALLNLAHYFATGYVLAASGFLVPIMIQAISTIGSFMIPHVLAIPPFPSFRAWLLFVGKLNLDEWDSIADLATAFSLRADTGPGALYLTLSLSSLLSTGVISIVSKVPASRKPKNALRLEGFRVAKTAFLGLPMLALDVYLLAFRQQLIVNASGWIVLFSFVVKLCAIAYHVVATVVKVRAILMEARRIQGKESEPSTHRGKA